VYYRFY
jgi:hypothetical protein